MWGISKLFERMKKPKHEFLAVGAVMLGWHPLVGISVFDPLANRYLVHEPGTTVIKNYGQPSKIPADHFHGYAGVPSELAKTFNLRHSVAQQLREGQTTLTIETFEISGLFDKPVLLTRSLSPDGNGSGQIRIGDMTNNYTIASEMAAGYLNDLHSYLSRKKPVVRKPQLA